MWGLDRPRLPLQTYGHRHFPCFMDLRFAPELLRFSPILAWQGFVKVKLQIISTYKKKKKDHNTV